MKEEDVHPDVIKEGMNMTFPLRRHQVVKERMTVKKMKKTYPQLFSLEQVCQFSYFFSLFSLLFRQNANTLCRSGSSKCDCFIAKAIVLGIDAL